MADKPLLTIGIPVYDDFDGLRSTVQALRLYHSEMMPMVEIIVVNNNPDSPHGKRIEEWSRWPDNNLAGFRHIPYRVQGSAAAKQHCFEQARADWVLCVDSHVEIFPFVIALILDYCRDNPDSVNLLHGPVMFDDCTTPQTDFSITWGNHMLGQWRLEPDLDCGILPHQIPAAEPFEIQASGCGLMLCRKAAWPGFNEYFRGFGAEEVYIHEKIRRAGGKVYCLPWMRWGHRFGTVEGPRDRRPLYGIARNYVIGWQELGKPIDEIREQFVGDGKLTAENWDYLIENPITHERLPCGECGGQPAPDGAPAGVPGLPPLELLYRRAKNSPGPLNEHCEALSALAKTCPRVAELGFQWGISTVSFLHGGARSIWILTDKYDPAIDALKGAAMGVAQIQFNPYAATGAKLAEMPEVDLLFIDEFHTAARVGEQLRAVAGRVKRYIVLHDTETFGQIGEDGTPGVMVGLAEFLRANPNWSVLSHAKNNHGLTVLTCDPEEKPALPSIVDRALTFGEHFFDHIKDLGKRADVEIYEDRLNTCAVCPLRVNRDCSACGCYLPEKAAWRSATCDAGKWTR